MEGTRGKRARGLQTLEGWQAGGLGGCWAGGLTAGRIGKLTGGLSGGRKAWRASGETVGNLHGWDGGAREGWRAEGFRPQGFVIMRQRFGNSGRVFWACDYGDSGDE